MVFGARDVEGAREEPTRRGATFGGVMISGELHLCDGRDPEGNVFQLSNRPSVQRGFADRAFVTSSSAGACACVV